MQITSVSFFDQSFGVLAKKYGEDVLMSKIRLEEIDPFDLALVRELFRHVRGNQKNLASSRPAEDNLLLLRLRGAFVSFANEASG